MLSNRNNTSSNTSHTNLCAYDLEKFRLFLAGHNLPALKDQEGVLVLGRMGAGKSTTIAIQLGAKYYYDPIEKDYKIDSQVFTPRTSKGSVSTTLNIGSYYDNKNRLLYLDTAGLNESRGKEEDLWTKNNLSLLFSIIKSFKAIVVVIDYGETFRGRDASIRDLAEKISEFTTGDDRLYQNMIFVITNAYDRGHIMTIEDVTEKAKSMITEFTQRENELIKSLERRYPLSSISGFTGNARGHGPSFNVADVPENDKQILQSYRDTQKLLNIIAAQDGSSIILSPYPDDEIGQQHVRRLLPQKIHAMPSITREVLHDIRNRNMTDSRLIFLNTLSSVVTSYSTNLSNCVALMQRLVDFYEENSSTLDAINNNWSSVKSRILSKHAREITNFQTTIENQEREISKLKTSTDEVVREMEHIRQKKTFGWIDLVSWTWGGSTVNYTYEFTKQLFIKYDYEDIKEDFKRPPSIIDNNPTKGKLKINFESYGGRGLDFKIRVWVYEKDHPSTIERRSVLTDEMRENVKQKKALEDTERAINAAKTKFELQQVVTRESQRYKAQLETVMFAFDSPIRINEAKREWHAIKGLESILNLITVSKMLHPLLTPANTSAINDFLKLCKKLNELSRNKYLKDIAKEVHEIIMQDTSNILDERTAPTNQAYILRNDAQVFTQNLYKNANGLFNNYPFESSAAAIVVGILGFIKYSGFSGIISLALIGFGIFKMTEFIRISVEKKLQSFEATIEEIKRDITIEAQKANISAREVGMFAVNKLSEKVKVDIDFGRNVKGIFNPSVVNVSV